MPDGTYSGYSGYKGGLDSYPKKPNPYQEKSTSVEKQGSKEKDPKNFFDRKRDEWINAFEDKQLGAEISQSIRAMMFAIPEGKIPRTESETHALFEDLEKLVRQKMVNMKLPGAYGDQLRYAKPYSYEKKKIFEFIDHVIPSTFFDHPKQDIDSLNKIISADFDIEINRWEQKQHVVHSSDRLATFADAVSDVAKCEYGDHTRLNRFLLALQNVYEAPRRTYGFHNHWERDELTSEEREQTYQKQKADFDEQVKDDSFFDSTLNTLKQIASQENYWISDNSYDRFVALSRVDRFEFLRTAPSFLEKGIDSVFLLTNFEFLKKADASKDGFDMFQTRTEKYNWLDRCLSYMFLTNEKSDQPYVVFTRDALQTPAPRVVGEIDEDSSDDLGSSPGVSDAKFLREVATTRIQRKMEDAIDCGYISVDVFSSIERLLGETGSEMIREFDEKSAALIKDDALGTVVSFMKNDIFKKYLPNIHRQLMTRIIEKIGVDMSVSESVASNFSYFYEQPNAEALARVLSQKLSTAKMLYQFFLVSSSLKPWQKDLMTEIEMLHTTAQLNPPPPKQRLWGEKATFLDADPYENHPHTYGGGNMRLGEVMSGKKNPEEVGLDLKPENVEFLHEVNRLLDAEHQAFLHAVDTSTLIPPEDKIAYMNPSESLVKMNDIKDSIRTFLARYLAQSVMKRADLLTSRKFSSDALRVMIRDGYAKFLDVYATDIPLYDKLYEEFDALRDSGRSPLEVYLGRDGIYAYIGRKAQDATRKAVLGKEKVEGLRQEGEVVAIEPKYLVYPSYVRDEVATDTKQEYLKYHGVTKDADPLFYDTGYSGSIPEQIMKIMDFDAAEIEERIRLLSAVKSERRMRGISANAKGEVIEKIENNPKSEETASGLVKNPETGQITHSAVPASPEDQFKFSLIRQAITRHYLIQERLHYEVPENTILDSEKFTLRIRSEYAEKLPDAFKANPIQFLETQGTPEDGAVLMTLTDGTDVMARRVEWTKTKQAQTEYAILISAKKAGVPAAEPVGFVSGKSRDDESVILAKKIEGVPGKRFEKKLRESGKYSDEQIQAFMKELQGHIDAVTTLLKQTLNITGNWKVHDVAVQFNDETGVIERVIPLKWEQVKRRDEEKEKRVEDLIQKPYQDSYNDDEY